MARGGMARVFLATLRGAVGFEKRLVVKQIRPELASDDEFVQRFVAEAKTAVSLSHPNIVPVYELGVEQGTYYIAMELCEGVTLAELLQRRMVLSAVEGAYVGVEMCRALDYAHRRLVVHRDITPRNVMVDTEGAVRLIDFGIASSVARSSREQQVFGSLGHMSPEHLQGEPVVPQSDLFSVGTVLIEAWTGKAPFRRETIEEARAALDQPPPLLSDSNLELQPLDVLLCRTVDSRITERPRAAEDLARPLREFLKAVDVGDVARRLGQQVAEVMDDRASRPPPPAVPEGNDRATAGLGGKTQTFAVKHEFDELTRPLGGLATKGEGAARNTRPRRRVMWLGLGLTLALVLIALIWRKSSESRVIQAAPTAPVVAAASPEQPGATNAISRAAPSGDPSSVQASQGPQNSSPSALPKSSPAPTTGKTATLQGFLTLSSEPPCQVLIAGKPRGRTPVRDLPLPVGSYRVEFVSDLMDERLGTSIELAAGVHRQLHADFTAATPRLVPR